MRRVLDERRRSAFRRGYPDPARRKSVGVILFTAAESDFDLTVVDVMTRLAGPLSVSTSSKRPNSEPTRRHHGLSRRARCAELACPICMKMSAVFTHGDRGRLRSAAVCSELYVSTSIALSASTTCSVTMSATPCFRKPQPGCANKTSRRRYRRACRRRRIPCLLSPRPRIVTRLIPARALCSERSVAPSRLRGSSADRRSASASLSIPKTARTRRHC